jgi:hypothetical protein
LCVAVNCRRELEMLEITGFAARGRRSTARHEVAKNKSDATVSDTGMSLLRGGAEGPARSGDFSCGAEVGAGEVDFRRTRLVRFTPIFTKPKSERFLKRTFQRLEARQNPKELR